MKIHIVALLDISVYKKENICYIYKNREMVETKAGHKRLIRSEQIILFRRQSTLL